jgi:hypothetical protein
LAGERDLLMRRVRVRVTIMGSQQCRNVGNLSQFFL